MNDRISVHGKERVPFGWASAGSGSITVAPEEPEPVDGFLWSCEREGKEGKMSFNNEQYINSVPQYLC
jgi:hypothetical protein